ncbi:MAG: hypothetical protein RL607_743 [Bacteroidota bacterium]
MNNSATFLVLLFLAITFLMSTHEKLFHWEVTVKGLKEHFKNSILKNLVPHVTGILLVTELAAGILSAVGCIQLYINGERTFGYYGAVASCIAILQMLVGQRLAKDYDGARNMVIYFLPAILAVYWLS